MFSLKRHSNKAITDQRVIFRQGTNDPGGREFEIGILGPTGNVCLSERLPDSDSRKLVEFLQNRYPSAKITLANVNQPPAPTIFDDDEDDDTEIFDE